MELGSDRLSYDTTGLSKATGICATLIRDAVRSGELQARYIGRKPIFLVEDARAWLASRSNVAPRKQGVAQ